MTHLTALLCATQPETWQASERALLAKMLSEFMYEEIVVPEPIADRALGSDSVAFQLQLTGDLVYRFRAKTRLFDSYRVIPESVRRGEQGQWRDAYDPLQFILDIRDTVGIKPTVAGHFLKELSHTLLADAHIRART